eukprot:788516_1
MTPVTRIAYFVFAALLLLDSSAGEQEVRTYDVLMDGPNVSIEGRTTSASPNFSFKIRTGPGVEYISVGTVCPENSNSFSTALSIRYGLSSGKRIGRIIRGGGTYDPSEWLERTPGDATRCSGLATLKYVRLNPHANDYLVELS